MSDRRAQQLGLGLSGKGDRQPAQPVLRTDLEPHYNGPDYAAKRDHGRLQAQTQAIFALMRDGVWRTLQSIADATSAPPASVSAQLRHLRKPRFGAHTVEKRYLGDGLYEYRLVVNEGDSR